MVELTFREASRCLLLLFISNHNYPLSTNPNGVSRDYNNQRCCEQDA
jgi:hypothetical protein